MVIQTTSFVSSAPARLSGAINTWLAEHPEAEYVDLKVLVAAKRETCDEPASPWFYLALLIYRDLDLEEFVKRQEDFQDQQDTQADALGTLY